jgi:hypothetical protein
MTTAVANPVQSASEDNLPLYAIEWMREIESFLVKFPWADYGNTNDCSVLTNVYSTLAQTFFF